MTSIYDLEEILLKCSKCGAQAARRVFELRTKVQISCLSCGSAIPVGNLTERVLEAVRRRLDGDVPDGSDSE